ncbi:glycoside hydrolase family 3 protein [Streptomyces sp. 3214.6]|uniref:glycoside hydrolase family 3 protein n=1 Tax=Streptomyces sp. 3214.6 TaxID=1882757 RepID=UPI00090C0DEC|nr:glycoside hydrolase family 3 protein [Streptomyces sp. 3214.6]SHH37558.1 exo-1,4-beta-glucosidase [Streptomyces sp. 3214.6]
MSTDAVTLPFRDPGLPLAERVEDLLSRLTLEERIAMLHQYSPAIPRLGVAEFRTGTETLHGVSWLGEATTFPQAVGLGATWDENLVREVAAAISVEQRAFHHHRPPVSGTGRNSLQGWAPVVNLLRDPRWGRNEEGYSEDPLLSARLGTAFCRGMTGDHPTYLRTAPVLKHFLAYNNEDDRCTTSSAIRPRVLHEYDLAAFRPAIATGAATGVMAAYNLVNGRPCHVSPLLEQELRRWAEPTGHELFVVSDAEAPSNLVDPEHDFDDHAASHAAALKAGIDSFTDHGEDSPVTIGRITAALERGLVTQDDIDRAVRRQLSIRFRLGEFDPGLDPYAGIGWDVVNSPAHQALALRAATEQVVLLKNTGLLPLAPERRIAVVGPLACTLFEDWYSGTHPYRVTVSDGLGVEGVEGVDRIVLRTTDGQAVTAVGEDGLLVLGQAQDTDAAAQFDLFDWDLGVLTLRSAATGRYASLRDADQRVAANRDQPGDWFVHETFHLEPATDGTEVLRNQFTGHYAQADPATGELTMTADTPEQALRFTRTTVRDGIISAVAAAQASDVTIVVLGNDPHINGRETQDRAGLRLPPQQDRLLREIAAVRPDTVLVVMSSYPYAVNWADQHLPAIVWTSHAGQETGRALAAVLRGDTDATGRLPQTWYRSDDELPAPLDYDIIKAGWTYLYHQTAPLYPFGHGLSYTTFDYGEPQLGQTELAADGEVTATLTVTNTGTRPGTETVQLYTRHLDARYHAPQLRLAAYRKVRLAAGETTELEFTLPATGALAHWDVATSAFTVHPGRYELITARSASQPVRSATLTVTGPAPEPRRVLEVPLHAADFDDYENITLVDATPTHGDAVTPTAEHGELLFCDVDLTGAGSVALQVSRTAPGTARLQLWTGDRLLTTVTVPSTGDRHTWTTVLADLTGHQPTGVHDLRVILTGEQRLTTLTFTP